VRARVRGTLAVAVEAVANRPVVLVRSRPSARRGALRPVDGASLEAAAEQALALRRPLVLVLATSGSDVLDGVDALAGWGRAARAVARCSGVVPVVAVVDGPAISGPALLLGLADVVVATTASFAYLSGPRMVASFTGVEVGLHELGGADVHARRSGVAAFVAADLDDAMDQVAAVLDHLPDHADALAPRRPTDDPPDRSTGELTAVVPAAATASYDVRQVARAIVDDGDLLEPWALWAPQVVTALAHVDGQAIGIVANQPQAMAGTLDIAASQKAARFVRLCDSFNLPILTLVDTPGFLPGKDLEWRGMIRHGAELAFAYAEATVPRVCLVLRKAYGGAYIVMDSKGMGNDICLAWPFAEIAVMGAEGAVQILHRRADPADHDRLRADYAERLCTPWVAAERGFVDAVVAPAESRAAICRAVAMLTSRREAIVGRKHDNGPL
jgi:acetyl-CoA carboxylase carboxyltransferase component